MVFLEEQQPGVRLCRHGQTRGAGLQIALS